MHHSFRYFKNTDCTYHPCHKVQGEAFNCLFCFCPLYHFPDCGGSPKYAGGIKDCSACTLPHEADGYDRVMERMGRYFAQKRAGEDGGPLE